MYLEHFGLTEPPFRITPHTEFFFAGANRGATLDALLYAVLHDEGIIKISGEVGSGKTMLSRVLIDKLPDHADVVYLGNPSLSREDIVYAIADELDLALPENARPNVALKGLQTHLIELYGKGRRVVVLIDEAHAMPAETLEEIRLLSNLESNQHKLLQLVLFGQPELNDVLARADMRQLKERITHNFSLGPLDRSAIEEYLEFRMRAAGYKGPSVFAPAATRHIEGASKGLTRRINILADKALLAAFAAGTHQITAKQVRAAIRDCDFSKATGESKNLGRGPIVTIAVAAVAVIAVAVALFVSSQSTRPPPLGAVAATAGQAVAQTPPASSLAAPAAATTPSTPLRQTPATITPLTEQALERGKQWLAAAPDSAWFLQLHAVDADDASKVEDYLRRFGKDAQMENVRVYASDLSGRLRYGVVYGQYADRTTAEAAVAELPAWVRASRPFPRQVKRLR